MAAWRPAEHLDVLVIGAGLSGIGVAVHLRTSHPGRRVALLEARGALGGTWDLFRYPGVRSDSDMNTLSFAFRPWREDAAIVDGPAILRYLAETARAHGVDEWIRYGHRVVAAGWSSADRRWTVDVELADGTPGPGPDQDAAAGRRRVRLTCDVLVGCSGYYRYDHGYEPDFPGRDRFAGRVVHPQHWPDDLDHGDARVVVIGSGATAISLVPALAERAAHVTMLQRSPTYVASLPAVDPLATRLRRALPDRWAGTLIRRRNIVSQQFVYRLSRRRPELVRRELLRRVREALPAGYAVSRHFTPSYDPWDQRLCVVPDGDLFRVISSGQAEVVTDHVDTFTEHGILLRSGRELACDVIVTATGLRMALFDGIALSVDGEPVRVPDRLMYKGMMLEGVPNFAFVFGYANASWTLKVDLVGRHLGRLLRHLDRSGHRVFVPVDPAGPVGGADGTNDEAALLGLTSGYVRRAAGELPRQDTRAPWRARMSYPRDLRALRFGRVTSPALRFDPPLPGPAPSPAQGTDPASPVVPAPRPPRRTEPARGGMAPARRDP
ncbi:NAD(P)/FAD-dependent oxidoreductase [Frankia sp. CNm7]|uniref:NAD(P)/FAD-dependent oxidoreductase n=1 Tax=Frankia nepalensis TaxID=1836974 RepID=A0A937RB50_9ACTN|nr:NAD(P)/FAD-dependent oxidoreductase [Frankia nepalensis]MBL7502440.1 NAD(P)/FAD-dependent oxidoreductase [Frankia nepalensis]MBL7516305.1 NAD(P)/FAD-dependent oxidoreductase [Frankia nepalensis]MBL7522066.1 NAD(P)/FAD-dependent oxidoreductase [Frankia nepalensis]MBL7625669.1 NAD(P)/FAD-dependent oxidoreductase [Frankia nepalensis]